MRTTVAALRLSRGDPQAATLAIAPTLEGSATVYTRHIWLVHAFLLEAIARDALGDAAASEQALERALDLAEPDGVLLPFLLYPAPDLLERHSQHRTAHAALLSEIRSLLAGRAPVSMPGESQRLSEALSESETRVLRYFPTNLSLRDIANELYVSVHTVETHAKHIYSKLDVHGRAEAVERARRLRLLAPSPIRR
jgi:LuxR family maltose regulon positive regulatory protein